MLNIFSSNFFMQKSWLGIDFTKLNIDLNPFLIANKRFYQAFYLALFQKYPTYHALPSEWRFRKHFEAQVLSEFIQDGPLLSYGCGIGYLESLLLQDRKQLYLTDFDDFCLRYNSESQFIYNLEENSSKFKHILLSQVVYSLTDKEFLDIVDFLRIKLLPNGSLVITFKSDEDNLSDERSFTSKTFIILKTIFYFFRFLLRNNFSKWQG